MSRDTSEGAAQQILSNQIDQRAGERYRLLHQLAEQTIQEATRQGLKGLDFAMLGGLLLAQANQQAAREQLADLSLRVNYLCNKLDVSNEELYAYIEFLPDEESDVDV